MRDTVVPDQQHTQEGALANNFCCGAAEGNTCARRFSQLGFGPNRIGRHTSNRNSGSAPQELSSHGTLKEGANELDTQEAHNTPCTYQIIFRIPPLNLRSGSKGSNQSNQSRQPVGQKEVK